MSSLQVSARPAVEPLLDTDDRRGKSSSRESDGLATRLGGRAAVRFRDRFGSSDPIWSLIGFFAHGRLLAAPRPIRG